MKRPTTVRDEERAAYEIVRRTLRVPVVHRDDGLRQGEVDAHICGRGVEPEALEVTIVGDEATLEVENRLVQSEPPSIVGLRWRWDVRPGPRTRCKGFHDLLTVLLTACEAAGVTRPDDLNPASDMEAHALAAYLDSDCTIFGNPNTDAPGTIDVLPAVIGGALDKRLTGLTSWLTAALSDGHLARHVDKLGRSRLPRRHLFLIIHTSGMPFALYDALAFGSHVPPDNPGLPEAVTDLWMTTGWRAGGVLRFDPSLGWLRNAPFDAGNDACHVRETASSRVA